MRVLLLWAGCLCCIRTIAVLPNYCHVSDALLRWTVPHAVQYSKCVGAADGPPPPADGDAAATVSGTIAESAAQKQHLPSP